jgi:hypothetical protein
MNTMQPVVMQKRTTRWMRLRFQNHYSLARAKGQLSEAVGFAESAPRYRDMAATDSNAQIVANTRSKLEAEQYLSKISLLESQKQRNWCSEMRCFQESGW